MPVTTLELQNFKSYAGLQTIGPFRSFTCIVGPNGSGKSNLMDALSFVLGVQSKALRSQQLQDLIYRKPSETESNEPAAAASSKTRKSAAHNLGAFVKLYYQTEPPEGDSDTEDEDESGDDEDDSPRRSRRIVKAARRAAHEAEQQEDDDTRSTPRSVRGSAKKARKSSRKVDDDTRVICFGRSISPQGVGEYSLDGKKVTYTVYESALQQVGVLVKARNFLVFQGDVEALARKTPQQLVQLVDVLSGSHDLQGQYLQAQRRQHEAQQVCLQHSKTQKTLKNERRLLRQQKQEAETYEKLLDDRSSLRRELYLWLVFHLQTDLDEATEAWQTALEHQQACQLQQDQQSQAWTQAKRALSQVRRQQSQSRDALQQAQAHHDQLVQTTVQANQQQVKGLQNKLTADEKALHKAEAAANKQQSEIESLDEEIAETEENLKTLETEYQARKQEAANVQLTQEQEAEYERLREEAATTTATLMPQVQQAQRRVEQARRQATQIQGNLQQAEQQVETTQKKVGELRTRKETITKGMEQNEVELKKVEKSLVELQKSQRATAVRRQELDIEIEEIQGKLREAKDDRSKSKDEERLQNAVSSLQRYLDGGSNAVFGRLVELCRPTQRQFHLAVTVAAGKDMDSIVVDSMHTAMEGIQYLREQRIGTATFLPLTSLQVPTEESTQHIRSVINRDPRFRLAIDVMQPTGATTTDVTKAIKYSVGNTVICDDLDSARELCFGRGAGGTGQLRVKAVTLQGAVISKGGTMTGGLTRDDNKRSGSRWKEQEVEKLRKRHKDLEDERSKMEAPSQQRDALEDVQNNLGNFRNKKQFMKSDLEYTTPQLTEQESLLKTLTQQIQIFRKQSQSAERNFEKMNTKLEDARTALRDVEKKVWQPFCEATGLKDIQAYEKAIGKERDEFNDNKRTLDQQISALKQKREYEVNRDVKKPIERIQQRITERTKALEKAKQKQASLQKQLDTAKASVEEAEAAMEEAKNKEKELADKAQEAQTAYEKARSESQAANKAVHAEETSLERLRGKLHESLQKARVEEVDLPMVDDDDPRKAARTRLQRRKNKRANAEGEIDEGDDEEEEGESGDESQPTSGQTSFPFTQESVSQTHFSQAENRVVVRDREKAQKVDFSGLRSELKERVQEREERKIRKDFDDRLAKISSDLEGMTPNLKAAEAFGNVSDKLQISTSDYSKAKTEETQATAEFKRLKKERSRLFQDAFDHIDDALKTIYTDMTKSSKHPLGGNAYLSLDDTEEPFLGGMKFNAMPPMKRFRDMEQLSGGEKTVAALSLLFAIHSFRPAPFFVMDEVDAALDNVNLRKICNYIRQRSQTDFQCIVISLKDMFYEQAQSLVGICRDVGTNSSRTMTLDLTKFAANEPEPNKRKRQHSSGSDTSSVGSWSKRSRTSVTDDDDANESVGTHTT